MQPKHKLYKKLFGFGFILLLFSFPLLLLLKIEAAKFHKYLDDLSSDKGIICAFFLIGIVFVCIGLLFKAFTKD